MKTSFREKLSRGVSLTGWLHNPRLTLILSFLLAIILWVVVMSNSNNVQTRTLTVPVTVDLADTYAEQIGLHLTSDADAEVSVTVRGSLSALSTLSPSDVRVRADVSAVQKAGKQEVGLVLSRNSENVDYDIVSCSPSSIAVDCDYWETKEFAVEVDIASLGVTDEKNLQLGKPILESVLTEGKLTVSGPQTTVRKIRSLVAKVAEEKKLSETATFRAAVEAVGEKGAAVPLEHCTFGELDGSELAVTVPVEAYKELTLTYEWVHAPKAMADGSKFVTVTPKKVKVLGPVDVIRAMEDTWSLGKIDFDTLSCRAYKWNVPLTPADNVTVVGTDKPSAEMKLDLSKYKTKTVTLTLGKDNVRFQNVPKGKTAAVQKKQVKLTLCGTEKDLKAVTAESLSLSVDLGEATGTGTAEYTGRAVVAGTNGVWVNYGAGKSGVPAVVTLSEKKTEPTTKE